MYEIMGVPSLRGGSVVVVCCMGGARPHPGGCVLLLLFCFWLCLRSYDIDAWGAKHDELELSSDGEDQQAGERRGVSEKFSDFVLPSLDALPLIFDLPLKACAATLSPAAPRQRKRPRDSNDNGDDVDSARQSRPRIDRGGEAPAARERASSGDAASAVPGATVNTPGGVGATAATPTVSSARKPTPVGVLRPEALPQVATPVSREKKPAAAHRRDVKRSIAKPLLQDLPPRRRGSPRVGKVYSGRHRVYAMGPTSKDRISPS